jgi:uncharacterized membrane protein YfcA
MAAFIDAVAGGGGLITVPAYLMAGLPPHLALGTNKFAASFGSCTSAYKFTKSGKVNFKLLKFLIPFTFLGAVIGVRTVLSIDESILNGVVLILILFIGIYTLFSKSMGMEDRSKKITKSNLFLGILLAFSLGFYDGFFGPGTGSFLVFGLIYLYGFDFIRASGNGRVLNFVSNITSLFLFALNGQIVYKIGIPVAVSMILGARLGAIVAIKKGGKFIKPIFVTMSLAVAVKMIYSLIV